MSKYLSYLLRHGAVKEGLDIDKEGFVKVTELLEFLVNNKSDIATMEQIKQIVDTDQKKRFLLINKENNFYIRASQGHSIVTVMEDAMVPIIDPNQYPEVIHGTFRKNLKSILDTGLSKMARNHIHFANGLSATSGIRKNTNVLIYINMDLALSEGIKFFISDNGVILTPGNESGILESKYFKKVCDTKGNDLLLPVEPNIPCAGCIVFHKINNITHVCLVGTHSGAYSFPKGKRNKEENLMICALRELEEETGINSNQIRKLDPTKYINEASSRNENNISIRLFITEIIDDNIILAPEDLEEIAICQFYPIENAMTLLNPKRKEVLSKALLL